MKRLLLVVLALSLSVSAQMWPMPGPGSPAAVTPSGGETYTDNFAGTSLSANWTSYSGTGFGPPTVTSNTVVNTRVAGSPKSLFYYSAGTFTSNQWSQATVGAAYSSYYIGNGVCIHLDSNGNGYCFDYKSKNRIVRLDSGVETSIGAYCPGFTLGDVIKIVRSGSTIGISKNGAALTCTVTDTTYTSGFPGLFINGSQYNISGTWSAWSGGSN